MEEGVLRGEGAIHLFLSSELLAAFVWNSNECYDVNIATFVNLTCQEGLWLYDAIKERWMNRWMDV